MITSRLRLSLSTLERLTITHSLSVIALIDNDEPPRRSLQACQPLTLSLGQRQQVRQSFTGLHILDLCAARGIPRTGID